MRSSSKTSKIFAYTLAAYFQISVVFAACVTKLPPQVYFKPPYRTLSDNTNAVQPMTLPQITTALAATLPPEATDVQLIFYWSQICPTNLNSCNFSMVDAALNFWGSNHKKVILGFQTESYPTKIIENGSSTVTSATPKWVAASVRTYAHSTRVIGQAALGSGAAPPDMNSAFVVNWDPNFVQIVKRFITMIATKYDGNPNISSIIMTLGLNGEDLTFPDTPSLTVDNWTNNYQIPIVNQYITSFKRSKLEFDLALTGYLRRRAAAAHSTADTNALDAFIDYLVKNKVMISIEGLSPGTLSSAQGVANAELEAVNYILRAKRQGGAISLEAYQPLTSAAMTDLASIEAAIAMIRPSRLGLFNPAVNRSTDLTRKLLNDLQACLP